VRKFGLESLVSIPAGKRGEEVVEMPAAVSYARAFSGACVMEVTDR